jgi:hypothetical protein
MGAGMTAMLRMIILLLNRIMGPLLRQETDKRVRLCKPYGRLVMPCRLRIAHPPMGRDPP